MKERAAETVQSPRLHHYPALDGLRGLAVLMVIADHTLLLPTATGLAGAVTRLAHYGWLGVDLFFVLSGFLITSILLQTAPTPTGIRHFYIRRILRTWPLYYGCLAIALFILPFSSLFASTGLRDVEQNQLWFWLHGSNLLAALRGKWSAEFLDHFWSLAIEEQFYLVWPLIIVFLGARWKPLIPLACILLILTAIATRITLHLNGASQLMLYAFTLSRVDGLGWGALLAWAVTNHRIDAIPSARKIAWALLIVAFAAAIVVTRSGSSFLTWGLPWVNIAFTAIVLLALRPTRFTKTLLGRGILPFFGRYSYGLYVWHVFLRPVWTYYFSPSAMGVQFGTNLGTFVYLTLVLACSTAVAVASYWVFERKFLALKHKFR